MDQPSLRSLKCSIQNVLYIKVSKHFFLGLQTDSIVAEHVASLRVSSTLLSQPCEPDVVSKVLELFVIQKLTS